MCCTLGTLGTLNWLDFPRVHKPVKCLSGPVGIITWARHKHELMLQRLPFVVTAMGFKGWFLQLVIKIELKLKSTAQALHCAWQEFKDNVLLLYHSTQFWIKHASNATRLFMFPFYALSTKGSRGRSSQGFSTSYPAIQALADVAD